MQFSIFPLAQNLWQQCGDRTVEEDFWKGAKTNFLTVTTKETLLPQEPVWMLDINQSWWWSSPFMLPGHWSWWMLVLPMRRMVIMMVMMLQALSHVIYFPVGFATKPLPALGRHAGTPLGSLTLHETMVTMVIIVSWSSPCLSWSPWSWSCHGRHHGCLACNHSITGTRVAIIVVMGVLKWPPVVSQLPLSAELSWSSWYDMIWSTWFSWPGVPIIITKANTV